MDLRWQDITGDTFVLQNGQTLSDLLNERRPHWTEGREFGIRLPNDFVRLIVRINLILCD
jgi:hypothetical protein